MNNSILVPIAQAFNEAKSSPLLPKRSFDMRGKLWTPGQNLRISFFSATSDEHRLAIVDTARQWLKFANLHFTVVHDNDDTAEIRINTAVDEDNNLSHFGTDSLQIKGPSMLLGIPYLYEEGNVEDDEAVSEEAHWADFNATVLHEFGHALGMLHEHQHPDANIPWDYEVLRQILAASPSEVEYPASYGKPETEEEQLEFRMMFNFTPVVDGDWFSLPYDVTSIMHYPIPNELTGGKVSTDRTFELSEKDKQFMRLAYPGR